jgi:hypothetical protein
VCSEERSSVIHLVQNIVVQIKRVLTPNEVHLWLTFRPLLRHLHLMYPGTLAVHFLTCNETSATLAFFIRFQTHPGVVIAWWEYCFFANLVFWCSGVSMFWCFSF